LLISAGESLEFAAAMTPGDINGKFESTMEEPSSYSTTTVPNGTGGNHKSDVAKVEKARRATSRTKIIGKEEPSMESPEATPRKMKKSKSSKNASDKKLKHSNKSASTPGSFTIGSKEERLTTTPSKRGRDRQSKGRARSVSAHGDGVPASKGEDIFEISQKSCSDKKSKRRNASVSTPRESAMAIEDEPDDDDPGTTRKSDTKEMSSSKDRREHKTKRHCTATSIPVAFAVATDDEPDLIQMPGAFAAARDDEPDLMRPDTMEMSSSKLGRDHKPKRHNTSASKPGAFAMARDDEPDLMREPDTMEMSSSKLGRDHKPRRHNTSASKPGAFAMARDDKPDLMREPDTMEMSSSKLGRDHKPRRHNTSASKPGAFAMARDDEPDLMREPDTLEMSSSKKLGRDHKPRRYNTSASKPGAFAMARDDKQNLMREPEDRVTTVRNDQEPDLVEERSALMKHEGKSRLVDSTASSLIHAKPQTSAATTTAALDGIVKPVRATTGEGLLPGAVAIKASRENSIGRKIRSATPGAKAVRGHEAGAQHDIVHRKDPRQKNLDRVKPGSKKSTVDPGLAVESSGHDAYKDKMERKIKAMEKEWGTNSDDSVPENEGGPLLSVKDGNSQMANHLENPSTQEQSGAPIVYRADHGMVGIPDLVHGTTQAGYGGYGFGGYNDNDLAVAIAIEEDDEEDLFIPAAIEYDPDAKPPLHKNRRVRMYTIAVAFFLLFATVTAVIAVVGGNGGRATFSPTDSPTSSPSTSVEGKYRQQFILAVGEAVTQEGSPHEKAATWIIFEDPLKLSLDAPNLIQRYLLALFYYSITDNGSRQWRSCNPPVSDEDDACTFERFYLDEKGSESYASEPAIRWLSGTHECEWVGNLCDPVRVVRVVELCKYFSDMLMFRTTVSCYMHLIPVLLTVAQNISGTLPAELAYFPYLQSISLAFNEFTGTIPVLWGTMRQLINLEVHFNMLTGTIPDELWSLNVQNIAVGANLISGTIGTSIGLSTNLKGFHTFENMLSGSIPSEIGQLNYLSYTRNNQNLYSGSVPSELGKLTMLQEMWWYGNQLSGQIPSEFGFLEGMTDLRLHINSLNGTVPEDLYNCRVINTLFLDDTNISGTISTKIGQLTDMTYLRLRRTKLSGTIPTEIGLLSSLRVAWFHLTGLNGSMPSEICANVGPGLLEYLQADCSPEYAPSVECNCCSSCCDRETQLCLINQ
jgi:hypothetical protein